MVFDPNTIAPAVCVNHDPMSDYVLIFFKKKCLFSLFKHFIKLLDVHFVDTE